MTLTDTPTQMAADLPAGALLPALQRQALLDPIVIEEERPGDVDAREMLLDRAFGPSRFRKTCQRLRAGRLPARGLALVARARSAGLGAGAQVGGLLGTVRLWHVDAGGMPALMLGPLAVDSRYRASGIGARLMAEALDRARVLGHGAVILVGDAPYYARFGFSHGHVRGLRLPGPVDPARFLGVEIQPGALAAAQGLVKATGAVDLQRRRQAHRAKAQQQRLRYAA